MIVLPFQVRCITQTYLVWGRYCRGQLLFLRREPLLRLLHLGVELFHAEEGHAHVFRGRREDGEGQHRDEDARGDGDDHGGVARAQVEEGQLLLAHLRAHAVADEGDGAAHDDEYRYEKDTIHSSAGREDLHWSLR